jgi:hypothetical protein
MAKIEMRIERVAAEALLQPVSSGTKLIHAARMRRLRITSLKNARRSGREVRGRARR